VMRSCSGVAPLVGCAGAGFAGRAGFWGELLRAIVITRKKSFVQPVNEIPIANMPCLNRGAKLFEHLT
jgi:hypothetical protein